MAEHLQNPNKMLGCTSHKVSLRPKASFGAGSVNKLCSKGTRLSVSVNMSTEGNDLFTLKNCCNNSIHPLVLKHMRPVNEEK